MMNHTNSVNAELCAALTTAAIARDRRNFIGGSDARTIMGKDERRFIACGAKNGARRRLWTCRAS
jgi:hypothetical protein